MAPSVAASIVWWSQRCRSCGAFRQLALPFAVRAVAACAVVCIQRATVRHNLWMIPKEKRAVITLAQNDPHRPLLWLLRSGQPQIPPRSDAISIPTLAPSRLAKKRCFLRLRWRLDKQQVVLQSSGDGRRREQP